MKKLQEAVGCLYVGSLLLIFFHALARILPGQSIAWLENQQALVYGTSMAILFGLTLIAIKMAIRKKIFNQ